MAEEVVSYSATWNVADHNGFIQLNLQKGGIRTFGETLLTNPAEFQVIVDLLRMRNRYSWMRGHRASEPGRRSPWARRKSEHSSRCQSGVEMALVACWGRDGVVGRLRG